MLFLFHVDVHFDEDVRPIHPECRHVTVNHTTLAQIRNERRKSDLSMTLNKILTFFLRPITFFTSD